MKEGEEFADPPLNDSFQTSRRLVLRLFRGGFFVLKRLCDYFEEVLGALILSIMLVVTFANVVTRYLITYPLAFTEEITISMFVWIVLLGTSIAFRRNAHLAMTFFYDLMPRSLKKFCFIISTAVSLTLTVQIGRASCRERV